MPLWKTRDFNIILKESKRLFCIETELEICFLRDGNVKPWIAVAHLEAKKVDAVDYEKRCW